MQTHLPTKHTHICTLRVHVKDAREVPLIDVPRTGKQTASSPGKRISRSAASVTIDTHALKNEWGGAWVVRRVMVRV
jgi:hypothetical protein